MTPHVKIYMKFFDLGEQDIITCEGCLKQGRIDGQSFDIHHIQGRIGKESNAIRNLMALCRKCHDKAHNSKISKSELQYIHNCFLVGNRKQFIL